MAFPKSYLTSRREPQTRAWQNALEPRRGALHDAVRDAVLERHDDERAIPTRNQLLVPRTFTLWSSRAYSRITPEVSRGAARA